jgi:signal transduction histidine kinase
MAEGRPVEVIVSDEGAPDAVLTDELALTAILRNLLSNGIKYTNSGEVRLSMRTAEPRLEIITGLDVEQPPRAAALQHKDEVTRERLAFAIRNACRATS